MTPAEAGFDQLQRDCMVDSRNARNRSIWTYRFFSRVRCADLRSAEEQCRYNHQVLQARAALANFRRTVRAGQVLTLDRYRRRKVRWLSECTGLIRH